MRTIPPPGSRRVKAWVGKRIRTKVTMQSGVAEVPAGTLGTVKYAVSGLHIKFDGCSHCGVAIFMRKVSPYNVEVVPQ